MTRQQVVATMNKSSHMMPTFNASGKYHSKQFQQIKCLHKGMWTIAKLKGLGVQAPAAFDKEILWLLRRLACLIRFTTDRAFSMAGRPGTMERSKKSIALSLFPSSPCDISR